MIKTIITVDGMMCGMCETHIQEAIRKNFHVKKVTANRGKKEAVILSEERLDTEKLKAVINETGYVPGTVSSEPYEKKGLFGLF
ncbi:MAG: heavy-metal-associated domain-containing protein [Lachnospiraceae bacterium]|nr:heavy-metal-associated domain-containing protein [Lachnospiraceae bacterium]